METTHTTHAPMYQRVTVPLSNAALHIDNEAPRDATR